MARGKFIETDPGHRGGRDGEQKVWDAVKQAFRTRDCKAYWGYPIFSRTKDVRREPDIFIVDKELGLIIIEVKSINIDNIESIEGHLWRYQNFYAQEGNPYQQAENQLYAILTYCDREPEIKEKIKARCLVGLPLITNNQWQKK